MIISIGNKYVSPEELEERPCRLCGGVCGSEHTSDFAEIFTPTGCEIDGACANCPYDICDENCYYYEWSLKAAIIEASKHPEDNP